MRIALCCVFAALAACRRDGEDGEAALKWSCARVFKGGTATATVECAEQLKAENSAVLKHFTLVPATNDGKVVSYQLVARAPSDAPETPKAR